MQTILVFPKWAANPYLNMLYISAAAAAWKVSGATQLDQFYHQLATARAGDILHLHWTAPICQAMPSRAAARKSLTQFERAIQIANRAGVKLIWTVHNTLPHAIKYEDLETELSQFIADSAWRIIQLNQQTTEAVSPFFSLPREKLVTLRHASYKGLYEPQTRQAARDALGIPEAHTVIGFVGQVKPYKGIDTLLAAVGAFAQERDDVTLLIGGRTSPEDVQHLEDRFPGGVNVVARYEFIPDAELSDWVSASDVLALPYRRILNSGTLLLAATLARPVILPNDPHLLAEYGDQSWVEFFDRSGDEALSLASAIDRSLQDWQAKSEAAGAFAAEYTTYDMSRDYLHLIGSEGDA